CFLRLNLKTSTLSPRPLPRIVALRAPPAMISPPPSGNAALTASSTSEPTSPASFSTRITSPGATRYCFPPVSTIAYIRFLLDWEPEHTKCVGTTGVNSSVLQPGGGFQTRTVHVFGVLAGAL